MFRRAKDPRFKEERTFIGILAWAIWVVAVTQAIRFQVHDQQSHDLFRNPFFRWVACGPLPLFVAAGGRIGGRTAPPPETKKEVRDPFLVLAPPFVIWFVADLIARAYGWTAGSSIYLQGDPWPYMTERTTNLLMGWPLSPAALLAYYAVRRRKEQARAVQSNS